MTATSASSTRDPGATPRFRTIYVMPHSHFDNGYTHPQRMLQELQQDGLDDVLALCRETDGMSDAAAFRWTVEAHAVLTAWLKDAEPRKVDALKHYLKEGRIAVAALPFHTTPLANLSELYDSVQQIRALEERLDYRIRVAINHDVNGQPWTVQQILRQAGVELYMTGINIHFGGIPFERPALFDWYGPDGAPLRCYLGEHYARFSQFIRNDRLPELMAAGASDEAIYEAMRPGLRDYEAVLATRDWPHDYYILTATDPPLYDNNGPDRYLSRAVEAYNRVSPDQEIRLVTADDILEILQAGSGDAPVPRHDGDWTDYWNFGAGSTPREVTLHKRGQTLVQAADYLGTLTDAPSPRHARNMEEVRRSFLLHSEHTWGAAESVSDPTSDMTRAQRSHKDSRILDGVALAAHVLGERLERYHGQPGTFSLTDPDARYTIYNPTPYTMTLPIPEGFPYSEASTSSLMSLRTRSLLPFESGTLDPARDVRRAVRPRITLEGYSYRSLPATVPPDHDGPADAPDTRSAAVSLSSHDSRHAAMDHADSPFAYDGHGHLVTPYYDVTLSPDGGVTSLIERNGGHDWVAHGDIPWASVVRERTAKDEGTSRNMFFSRDLEGGATDESVWHPDWAAKREILAPSGAVEAAWSDAAAALAIPLRTEDGSAEGRLLLTFPADSPAIELKVDLNLRGTVSAEGYYLAFPTNVREGWRGYYDTAGTICELDRGQMGHVSKDWITLDSFYAMHDDARGLCFGAPDLPLWQPAGFGFGKQRERIERDAGPLVLAWLSNNYWETNFSADVRGKVGGRLVLMPSDHWQPLQALRVGAIAASPWIGIDDLADGRRADHGQTLAWTSEHVALQMLRGTGDTWILALRNTDTASARPFTLRIRDGAPEAVTVEDAEMITPRGDAIAPVDHTATEISGEVEAGALCFLRLRVGARGIFP